MTHNRKKQEAIAFTERVSQCGLSVLQMQEALAERGCVTRNNTPVTHSQIYSWYHGLSAVPQYLQPTVAEISGIEWPSGDTNLSKAQQQAAEAESLYLALKRLRQVLRMNHSQLSQALEPHLPSGTVPLPETIKLWEKSKFSGGKLPSRKIFNGTDVITAYGHVMELHGYGAWFEANAPHFRQLMEKAIEAEPTPRRFATQHPHSGSESRQR
jgi:hypothetical protein